MRCFLFATVVCTLLWPISQIQAAILPGNFLPNPSVEEDLDEDGIPDGWLLGGNNPAGDIWDDSEPISGERNLLLIDEGDASYTSWYTNVELPEDTEELEFQWTWKYVFTSENPSDEFRMTIAWRFEDSDIGYDSVVVREDEPDYVTEKILMQVPVDTDALRLEFVTGGPQTETGMMWIDDISIAIPGQILPGDFNADGEVDVADIDLLSAAVLSNDNEARFDLNGDLQVDAEDHRIWVKDLKQTWFGDANLDGLFNSTDLVAVFTAGEYEDGVALNSGWAEGDWNASLDFDSSDLVAAFTDGGYEAGAVAVQAVPEPASICLLAIGCAVLLSARRRERFNTLPTLP